MEKKKRGEQEGGNRNKGAFFFHVSKLKCSKFPFFFLKKRFCFRMF